MTARSWKLSLVAVVFALSARSVGASPITVTLDPGAVGTDFTYKTFLFSDLAGTHFDGQTISLDVMFSAFLVAPAVGIDLFLNQDGGVGTVPNLGLSVSGYLLDDAGLQFGPETEVPGSGWMPGQMWPHWPFVLNGAPFLPPTTIHSLRLAGTQQTRQHALLGPAIDIDPLVFSGVHFDITLPDTANTLIGSRLTIGSIPSEFPTFSREFPILVSPDPIPDYFPVTVPDSADTRFLLLYGLIALMVMRTRAFFRRG